MSCLGNNVIKEMILLWGYTEKKFNFASVAQNVSLFNSGLILPLFPNHTSLF